MASDLLKTFPSHVLKEPGRASDPTTLVLTFAPVSGVRRTVVRIFRSLITHADKPHDDSEEDVA